MMTDFPRVRRDHTCTKCLGVKNDGLLLCWPCHHEEKRFNDYSYSRAVEKLLERRERELNKVPFGWELVEA